MSEKPQETGWVVVCLIEGNEYSNTYNARVRAPDHEAAERIAKEFVRERIIGKLRYVSITYTEDEFKRVQERDSQWETPAWVARCRLAGNPFLDEITLKCFGRDERAARAWATKEGTARMTGHVSEVLYCIPVDDYLTGQKARNWNENFVFMGPA